MTKKTDPLSYPKENIKVLLLEGIHPTAEENFKNHEFINVETYSEAWSEEELLERIEDVQLIGIRSKTNITKKVIENAPKLKAVG
ncbi:MAG TPA: phosphoglycerate dehydrogenase, partial [Balneolaceae bacterium]|nr:phosphoglycerate dehydrogenase [Balneolaceae bacterium]